MVHRIFGSRLTNDNLQIIRIAFFDLIYCLSFKKINYGIIDPGRIWIIYCLSNLIVFVSAPLIWVAST